jgi:hypothetical protein
LKRALFIILISLLALVPAASAQFSTPLVITINGDFWTWYGDPSLPPVSITQWGYNEPGVLSPDGGRIAYNSVAQIAVDALNRVGPIGGGGLPSNIWVFDPISGSGTRLAEQPPDASFFTEGVADKGIVRSTPAWSPDGGRLAWAEQTYPDTVGSIVVYDFASGASIIVASNLPPSIGVPAPKEVLWGQNGIVVRDNQQGGDIFTVYQPNGSVSASFTVGGSARELAFYALMDGGGREVLGVLFNDGVWELFDLTSGAAQIAGGIPEMYSLRAGGGSLALSTRLAVSHGGCSMRRAVSAPSSCLRRTLCRSGTRSRPMVRRWRSAITSKISACSLMSSTSGKTAQSP